MKDLKLGWYLAHDWNYTPKFSLSEFNYSFLHGIGFNIGIAKIKLFGNNTYLK